MYRTETGRWVLTNKEVEALADYIIKNKSTIRRTASMIGMSKSTLHSILHTRLPDISHEKNKKLMYVLKNNFDNKHLQGGKATAARWLAEKKKKK